MDTIYALASAQGKAGISVIRISGPDAHAAVEVLAGNVPTPRRASLRRLRDSDGGHLDTALVLTFAAGQSFTGEAAAELHVHGSRAVVAAVLARLGRLGNTRLAEPGEFTRRALENNRMDLTEVEGLADLIDAETEAQRRQAVRVMAGALGRKAEAWRSSLVRAMALLEATIDFADEEVPEDVTPEVTQIVGAVREEILLELQGFTAAERIRDGFEVAIVGPPNIGKSTLLNRIAGRDAALTSEIAGTTRDVIEVRMDLRGLPVTLLDTAGLRETTDTVESLGIDRARVRAQQADLRVILENTDTAAEITPQDGDIVLRAKADLHGGDGVSGLTGQGVSTLLDAIADRAADRAAGAGLAVQERHRAALAHGSDALIAAVGDIENGAQPEIVAENLRRAVRSLDALVGRVDVEDMLDEVFTSFCLGK